MNREVTTEESPTGRDQAAHCGVFNMALEAIRTKASAVHESHITLFYGNESADPAPVAKALAPCVSLQGSPV